MKNHMDESKGREMPATGGRNAPNGSVCSPWGQVTHHLQRHLRLC